MLSACFFAIVLKFAFKIFSCCCCLFSHYFFLHYLAVEIHFYAFACSFFFFLIWMLTLWDIMPTVVIIYDNYDCGKCGPKQYGIRKAIDRANEASAINKIPLTKTFICFRISLLGIFFSIFNLFFLWFIICETFNKYLWLIAKNIENCNEERNICDYVADDKFI